MTLPLQNLTIWVGCLPFLTLVAVAQSVQLSGLVTIGGQVPLRNAIVRVQAPGLTVATTTDEAGRYSLFLERSQKLLLSVVQDGRLLHRDFIIDSSQPVNIDLPAKPSQKLKPVAMASFPARGIYMLDGGGRLDRYLGGIVEFVTRLPTATYYDLAPVLDDLSSAPSFYFTSTVGETIKTVTQLDSHGKQIKTHALSLIPGIPRAVVYGGQGRIFVRFHEPHSIYQIDAGHPSVKQIADLSAINDLTGHLVWDPHADELYIATRLGSIFRINVRTRTRKLFAKGVGSVDGLAMDSKNRLIIV